MRTSHWLGIGALVVGAGLVWLGVYLPHQPDFGLGAGLVAVGGLAIKPWDGSRVIRRCPRGKDEIVASQLPNGDVEIRRWQADSTGQMQPTKRGVTLPVSDLRAIITSPNLDK